MLRKILALLIVSLIGFIHPVVYAINDKASQTRAMDSLLLELETHYGLESYKKDSFNVTFSNLREKYTRLIDQARTLEEEKNLEPITERDLLSREEFQQLMIGMIAELRDGHVTSARQTSQSSTLGLTLMSFDGRLYVQSVVPQMNLNQFSETVKPGDEIIEIDGVSPQLLAKKKIFYT